MIARTPEAFAKAGIQVKLGTPVAAIDPGEKEVVTERGDVYPFDDLVVATGAEARRIGVEGEELEGVFRLRNLSDAIAMKGFIEAKKARRAVIVGGGLVSLEMCENLRLRGIDTVVLQRSGLPMKQIGREFGQKILDEMLRNQVVFKENTNVLGFERAGSGSIVAHTDSGNGLEQADLVVVGIGVVPNTALADQAGISLGESGAIQVNERLQTNFPYVYSAGDCCESFHLISKRPIHFPFGDVARKQGRVAGTNIGGKPGRFPGVVGSFCFKVFDLEVAGTGLTEDEASSAGYDPVSTTIRDYSRSGAYPEAKPIWLKVVADKASGRVLGGQGIGEEGVVWRVNVLATAVTTGLTVDDLCDLDLAYAPPFSGAADLIHIAGQQLAK
jgi:NADPH-dependent 2,4-dienoyl-CoA reductase/sulfur reductase-like enzyme